MINKIHILGASGSGTTTLASELCKQLGFKHLDTDNYFWEDTDPKFMEKRPVEDRLRLIRQEITHNKKWILSGSLCGWGDPLIEEFDLVIFLRIPKEVRLSRLYVREVQRYGDKIQEGKSWYKKHVEFMDWASQYDDGDTTVRSLKLHNEWLERVGCDVLRIEGAIEVDEKIDLVKKFIRDKKQ